MAQLVTIIGAHVGFVVNSRLIKKLGKPAMNAYRMRILGNGVRVKPVISSSK
jgi:hypothetical protein